MGRGRETEGRDQRGGEGQRELEEVELRRLTQEKERLEEEKWIEQQHTEALQGSERAAEQR